VAGSIDADSTTDLAVPCTGSDRIDLFFGRGNGEFHEGRSVPTVGRPGKLALGDMDGDGATDLAVSGSSIGIQYGTGKGDFPAPTLIGPAVGYSSSLAAGDINSDGIDDLVLAVQSDAALLVVLGDRARQLRNVLNVKLSAKVTSLGLIDLDRDGVLDITAGSKDEGLVHSILMGSPPELLVARSSRTLTSFLGYSVQDFDGDGVLDLAAITDRTSAIHIGSTDDSTDRAFLRGDPDANGTVNLTDAIAGLLHLFFSGTVSCEDAADTNDDGILDLTDPVATLLWLFQSGPAPPEPGPYDCGKDPNPDSLAECTGACTNAR
jgi:hypothetical protein